MLRRGHEVIVLCFGDRDTNEKINGVEVRGVRPLGHVGSAPVGCRFVAEFFRLSRWADVINFHSPNPMGEIALLLSPPLRGKIIICTYHGDAQRPEFFLPVYDAMLRRFFRRCDVVVVSNPPLSENSRVLKAVKEKIRVIPLGVRTENYESHRAPDFEEARRLLAPLPPSSFKVMFAGRMVYYKGLDVLMDSIKTLKERTFKTRKAKRRSISAFLVGSGPEEDGIRAFTAKNDLENDVLLLPHQPEGVYRALFSLADCFVLPSTHKTEAYGIVLAEAMASGLPLVSTELGTGTSWVNRDGETGIVVPPGDPDALARAIARLADNGEERNRMAVASRARARRFLREDTMLEAYDEVFRMYNARGQDAKTPA
jgi:rhamnosyl/mannosyltransferase